MGSEKSILWVDHLILFCLCTLVFFLPIAHTETIRALCFGIPLGLWVIKMIVQRRWLLRRTPLDIPISLFSLVAGLSLITAVDFQYSLEEFTGEWILGVVLFYLAANNFREDKIKYLLIVLLCGNLLMTVYGIYDFFQRGGTLFDYQIRAQSFHYSFGAFSTYLVTILPYLLIGLFAVKKEYPYRRILFLLLLLNLFVLYLTQARGAWVAAVVCLTFVGWKFLSKRNLIIAGGIGTILVLLVLPRSIFEHQTQITNPESPDQKIETGRARWELYKFVLERMVENPFRMLGFGQRSFVKKYPEFYNKYKGALLWHAHNTFLNIALQTGVQGLALFCLLIFVLLKYTFERTRAEPAPLPKFYFQATFMMIIALFVRTSTDDYFKDDSALLFWFLSGVAFSIKGRIKK